MFGELQQYLLLYKQLNVPGIGTFHMERMPASFDVASKLINPPSYSITLHHSNATPSQKIFGWLSEALLVPEQDAISRFNDFAFEIRNRIMAGEKLEWDGIGTLTKGMAGEIRFEPAVKGVTTGPPLPANRVIRENAEHTVRVGEDQKTSTEMLERLAVGDKHRSYWWAAALVLGLLAFVFIAWYFSTNGFNPPAAGNRQKMVPKNETATYRTIE
jgi:hypothetical protein